MASRCGMAASRHRLAGTVADRFDSNLFGNHTEVNMLRKTALSYRLKGIGLAMDHLGFETTA